MSNFPKVRTTTVITMDSCFTFYWHIINNGRWWWESTVFKPVFLQNRIFFWRVLYVIIQCWKDAPSCRSSCLHVQASLVYCGLESVLTCPQLWLNQVCVLAYGRWERTFVIWVIEVCCLGAVMELTLTLLSLW